MRFAFQYSKNKTNHLISSNRHNSATANIAVHYLKRGDTKPTGISYNCNNQRKCLRNTYVDCCGLDRSDIIR